MVSSLNQHRVAAIAVGILLHGVGASRLIAGFDQPLHPPTKGTFTKDLQEVAAFVKELGVKKVAYIGAPELLHVGEIWQLLVQAVEDLVGDGLEVAVDLPNSLFELLFPGPEDTISVANMSTVDVNMFGAILVAPGGPRTQAMARQFESHTVVIHLNIAKALKGDANEFGRVLLDDRFFEHDPVVQRRVQVLHETLEVLGSPDVRDQKLQQATVNVERWQQENQGHGSRAKLSRVRVESGDWGDVTHKLTKQFGTTFAVLNMANAYAPGGGYTEGMPAQEENMFRRTDCHYSVDEADFDMDVGKRPPKVTAQIQALSETRRVPLERDHPRVCIRGPEDRSRADLGYPWLEDDEIFPFYEMRAAAVNVRRGKFDKEGLEKEMRRRIEAQLDTLIDKHIRHAVLGAFGCGAFGNDAKDVAKYYREALESNGRLDHFDCVAFAIFYPGYGPDDNFQAFKSELGHL